MDCRVKPGNDGGVNTSGCLTSLTANCVMPFPTRISTLHGVVFVILSLPQPIGSGLGLGGYCFFFRLAVDAAASTTLSTASRQLRISAASTG
jgi:hypothetical protein